MDSSFGKHIHGVGLEDLVIYDYCSWLDSRNVILS
jgi:hypothetical protein